MKKRATDFSKSCSMGKKVFHNATVSTTLLGYFRKGNASSSPSLLHLVDVRWKRWREWGSMLETEPAVPQENGESRKSIALRPTLKFSEAEAGKPSCDWPTLEHKLSRPRAHDTCSSTERPRLLSESKIWARKLRGLVWFNRKERKEKKNTPWELQSWSSWWDATLQWTTKQHFCVGILRFLRS